jgi:hypothetical protein
MEEEYREGLLTLLLESRMGEPSFAMDWRLECGKEERWEEEEATER